MRMSMAKKIYCIIGIMALLAAGIAGLGLYSANEMSGAMTQIGLQANRTISLNVIDRIAQERRTITNSVIESVDEAEMKKMMDNDMKNLEASMTREIDKYYDNFPKPVTPAREANVASIRAMWADYVKVTNEIAALSYENSNARAERIYESGKKFWDDTDAEIERLARSLSTPGSARFQRQRQ